MKALFLRGREATVLLLFVAGPLHASTITKLNLGSTGPDIQLDGGMLSTVDDGNPSPASPGDQDTAVTFHGFVVGKNGLLDVIPPEQSSFTLADVALTGSPAVVNQGEFSLVTHATHGGNFFLYDKQGAVLLTGTLEAGSLHGTTGPSGTGGFLTASLGTFTGPTDSGLDQLFSLLQPGSASLAISLTDVASTVDGARTPGFFVSNGQLLGFTADATANVGGVQAAGTNQLPEPGGLSLAAAGLLALLGLVRRRR